MGEWQQTGRIASRPRWRASPRALLRGLGLSALIACAGCNSQPPEQPRREAGTGASGALTAYRDTATGCWYLGLYGKGLTPRLRRDGKPDCPGQQP